MNDYPVVVRQIAGDYLERLRSQLSPLPAAEREEFIREIESHIYEAYQQEPAGDDVARMLTVLRRLGEPAEVVAGRLAESMVRSGRTGKAPLYVLGGILIALFGVPLGFGGVAVLAGILATLACAVATYYAATGLVLLTAAILTAFGMMRMFLPDLWEKLVGLGVIRMWDGFDQLAPTQQGMLFILFAGLIAVGGISMLRLGRRMVRGLRLLVRLGSDWLLRGAAKLRQTVRQQNNAPRPQWSPALRRP